MVVGSDCNSMPLRSRLMNTAATRRPLLRHRRLLLDDGGEDHRLLGGLQRQAGGPRRPQRVQFARSWRRASARSWPRACRHGRSGRSREAAFLRRAAVRRSASPVSPGVSATSASTWAVVRPSGTVRRRTTVLPRCQQRHHLPGADRRRGTRTRRREARPPPPGCGRRGETPGAKR